MLFYKLRYGNNSTQKLDHEVSKRVEYFISYWTAIFLRPQLNFDPYYLRSHRTVIQKVRLQLEGNFDHSKKAIGEFLVDDMRFTPQNVVYRHIRKRGTTSAIQNLISLNTTLSKNNWLVHGPRFYLKEVAKIEKWLDNDYPSLILKLVTSLLDKSTHLNTTEMAEIKELVNCIIIELVHKGYSTDFIAKIPEMLLDPNKFPYERIKADFESEDAFMQYKVSIQRSLTISDQINSINTLLRRAIIKRRVIFKVFEVNLRIPSQTFLDVMFYNPVTQPNIVQNNLNIVNETFVGNSVANAQPSMCNAAVIVEGRDNSEIRKKAFEKTQIALGLFNDALKLSGRIYPRNSFVTRVDWVIASGSLSALNRDFIAVDQITPENLSRLELYDKLKVSRVEDKKVMAFASTLSNLVNDKEYDTPERLWMILEATFENEDVIQQLVKDIFRIHVHNVLYWHWQKFYYSSLNSDYSFAHPDLHYELSPRQCRRLGVTKPRSKQTINKFIANLNNIKAEIDTPYLSELTDYIEEYRSNRALFLDKMNDWITYLLRELYIQRNLNLHSNMDDDSFKLKKAELRSMMKVTRDYFLARYLGTKKRRTIVKVVAEIHRKAQAL